MHVFSLSALLLIFCTDFSKILPQVNGASCAESCDRFDNDPYTSNGCYNGCQIIRDNSDVVGFAKYSQYYCLNNWELYSELNNYEIRIIGAYESSLGSHGLGVERTAGDITVTLELCTDEDEFEYLNVNSTQDYIDAVFEKPVVLYLVNLEPVNWIITTDDDLIANNINIDTIYVGSLYNDNTTVNIENNLFSNDIDNIIIEFSTLYGYGYDCGSGNTQGLLESIKNEFGDDTYSFLGAYSYSTVSACVGSQEPTQLTLGFIYPNNSIYDIDSSDTAMDDESNDGSSNGSNGGLSGWYIFLIVMSVVCAFAILGRWLGTTNKQARKLPNKPNKPNNNYNNKRDEKVMSEGIHGSAYGSAHGKTDTSKQTSYQDTRGEGETMVGNMDDTANHNATGEYEIEAPPAYSAI